MLFPIDIGLFYLTFYPFGILCFAGLGARAGSLYVALSTVVGYWWFVPPVGGFGYSEEGLVAAGTFVVSQAIVAVIVMQLRRSRERLRQANNELKTLNRRLSELHEQVRTLYDQAPSGHDLLDRDGRYLEINDTALSWLGRRRDEVVGKAGPADFMTQESRRRFVAGFQELLARGHADGIEVDFVHRDGTIRRTIATVKAIRDARGRVLQLRTSLHDVTSLRRLQADNYRLVASQAIVADTDLIAMARIADRRIVWQSRGLATLLGRPAEASVGQCIRIVFPDDVSFERFIAEADEAAVVGGHLHRQLQLVRSDGRPVWIDISVGRVSRDSRESLWVFFDLTANRELEAARLQQGKLDAENRSLLESQRVKHAFLKRVSHEMRTPLNAVIGFADLLRRGTTTMTPAEREVGLEHISESGRQLLALVDDVLAFTEAEARAISIVPRPTSIGELIAGVVAGSKDMADQARLRIIVDVDPAVGMVAIDAERSMQAVASILSSALQRSPPDSTIVVRTRALEAERFSVEVQDTGPTIASGEGDAIFEVFSTAMTSAGSDVPGIGLRLAIARRLIEAQHGRIGVRRAAGGGNVLFIDLPRVVTPEPVAV